MLQIHSNATIMDPDGNPVKCKASLKHLGAVLENLGRIDPEIGSKLGTARQEFRALAQIWQHANISRRRKIQLYHSLILSKFMYGLQTIWLSKNLRQRIDAFHCQCLRRIMGIQHSYISRVSNATVLEQSGERSLSNQLLRQQLQFYGRIHRNELHPGHGLLNETIIQRRVGRPLLSWVRELRKHIEDMQVDSAAINNASHWRKVVDEYCSQL